MKSSKKAAAFLIGVATLVACSPERYRDLGSLEDFQKAFNADAGKARLLLLLSPT